MVRTIGYNVQAAVDAKHSLIVETEVTNTTSDLGALGSMAIKAQESPRSEESERRGRQRLLQREGGAALRHALE